MVLLGSQEIMSPESVLLPGDLWLIEKINTHISHIQGAQLSAGQQRSLLLQHAAKVEAAAAKLLESAPVETVRKRLCWDADAESLVWRVEAETARLEVEVEKVRKEVETAQAWAESEWAKMKRVDEELERHVKGAVGVISEAAQVRVEMERVHKLGRGTMAEAEKTSEGGGGSQGYSRMQQETRAILLELNRIAEKSTKMKYEVFRTMAEAGRLALEAERLRAEVHLVVCMTVEDWQKVARD